MDATFYNNVINNYYQSEMSIPRPMFTAFNQARRRWLRRARPPHIEQHNHRNFEFTIASYNVLADVLLQEHFHLYNGHDSEPWIYDWNYRKNNLLEELKVADSDILCLQEVQEEHYYNWFHPRLQEIGYTGLYKKRSGTKKDGCATFFKSGRFTLQSYQYIDFYKENCSFMDRNNVAVLVLLQPKSNKSHLPICVGNTHLLFNKRRGDIKLAQLVYFFAEVDRIAKDATSTVSKYLPILLCGDFNSTPYSPLYNFVCEGELRYEGLQRSIISGQSENGRSSLSTPFSKEIFPRDFGFTDDCRWSPASANQKSDNLSRKKIEKPAKQSDLPTSTAFGTGMLKHDLTLRSSYLHSSVDGTPEVTTCHERVADTVDYIFHSRHVNHNGEDCGLWLSGVLSLLSEYEVRKLGSLPNRLLSSDHLLLMSSFVLPESARKL